MKMKDFSKKLKEKPLLIIFLCSMISVLILFVYFMIENQIWKKETQQITQQSGELQKKELEQLTNLFYNPDRMVYKDNQNRYVIFEKGSDDYEELLRSLVDHLQETKTASREYTREEIDQIQKEHAFLTLDYDSISNNIIFPFYYDNTIMIRLKKGAGTSSNYSLLNKEEEFIQLVQTLAEEEKKYYGEITTNVYSVGAQTISGAETFDEKHPTIFKKVITNKQELEDFLKKNQISVEEGFFKTTYAENQWEDYSCVAIISKQEITAMHPSIGNLIYTFRSNEKSSYQVRFDKVSKIYNTKCIYAQITDVVDQNGKTEEEYQAELKQSPAYQNNEIKITETEAKNIAKQSLVGENASFTKITQVKQKIENRYMLERWDDKNHDYSTKYKPVDQVEYKNVWHVIAEDENQPGCAVSVYIDTATGEVLCIHWSGE